jgi:hypothetical protein
MTSFINLAYISTKELSPTFAYVFPEFTRPLLAARSVITSWIVIHFQRRRVIYTSWKKTRKYCRIYLLTNYSTDYMQSRQLSNAEWEADVYFVGMLLLGPCTLLRALCADLLARGTLAAWSRSADSFRPMNTFSGTPAVDLAGAHMEWLWRCWTWRRTKADWFGFLCNILL